MSTENKTGVTPTVAEVCVQPGPAYGQCWGCPVRECQLNIEPNTLTALTTGVALDAAQRLMENRTVIEGLGGRGLVAEMSQGAENNCDETAFEPTIEASLQLASLLNEPNAKRQLQIWMAAEAALLRVPALRNALVKAEDQYLRDWMKPYAESGRMPTDNEVMQRDARVDRLEASIAAQVYGIPGDTDEVREAIEFLKGHRLKPTLEYRRDHTTR